MAARERHAPLTLTPHQIEACGACARAIAALDPTTRKHWLAFWMEGLEEAAGATVVEEVDEVIGERRRAGGW
jgi:hypothetical protein